MVVYTPDQSLNPEKKALAGDGPEVTIQMEKEALTGVVNDSGDEDNVYNDTTAPVIIERRQAKQQKRLWLQLILLAGMITGLTLCVLGSIHLYRSMYSANYKYKGRCGVGVVDMPRINQTMNQPMAQKSVTDGYKEDVVRCSLFEDVEIDGPMETLQVPAQNSSAATIRNDFTQNKTLIKDTLKDLCFVLDFLPDFFTKDMVPSPQDFSISLSTIKSTDELPRVYQVEEYFSVSGTVDDVIAEFGESLSDICAGKQVYRTSPIPAFQYVPALAPTTEAIPTTPSVGPLDFLYKMYPGGNALYNYHLFMDNYDDY